jgi:DNA-binding NarL/FixJ family response regulator
MADVACDSVCAKSLYQDKNESNVMNVFIVEDHAWLLQLLNDLVLGVPHARVVGSADTAQGAIDAILATRPDVVLLDLMLKEGTGFDVLRGVREQIPNTKILVVTSFPNPGIKKACVIGGADGFFDKLLEMDEVRKTLETLAAKLNKVRKVTSP